MDFLRKRFVDIKQRFGDEENQIKRIGNSFYTSICFFNKWVGLNVCFKAHAMIGLYILVFHAIELELD